MPQKQVDVANKSVVFSFGDAGNLSVDLGDFPPEMITQLALHGLSQKGGDSYAGAKSATAESDMDADEWSKAQVESVVKQLQEGNWAVRSSGGGTGVTDLARALAEATGTDVSDAVERLADEDKEVKNQLRKHPDVAAILARLRRERAEAKEKDLAGKAGSGPDISEILG